MPTITNNHKRKLHNGRVKATKVKQAVHEGMAVQVVKAPKDATYLKDKTGIVVNTHGMACVKIGDCFTHFKYSDIKPVKRES